MRDIVLASLLSTPGTCSMMKVKIEGVRKLSIEAYARAIFKNGGPTRTRCMSHPAQCTDVIG